MAQSYFKYWGKAKPSSDKGAQFHLLPYHSLDVAAVAKVYLEQNHRLRSWFSEQLSLSEEFATELLVFLVAIHDLGKFAITFQNQRPDLLAQLQGITSALEYGTKHDTLGYRIWLHLKDELLAEQLDWEHTYKPLIRAVCGHHGQPPKMQNGLYGRFVLRRNFSAEDIDAVKAFYQDASQLMVSRQALRQLAQVDPYDIEENAEQLSWWLAGFTVLCDWIGSNTDWFAYQCKAELSLEQYWSQAQKKAEGALVQAGLSRVPSRLFDGAQSLFSYLNSPTPLQQKASELSLSPDANLLFLEDVTGAGKTEAALILVQRLMSVGAADGLYFALPSMATANAMYDRISSVYSKSFDQPASLVLAHSAKQLNQQFKDSVFTPSEEENDNAQADSSASARCAAWLADNRKKALLAQVGVGTIDQALQATLPNKHQSLRLIGLLGKVLLIDEVHSADSYQNELLCALLKFHAAAGGSAILMSATLSLSQRQKLSNAWHQGLGVQPATLQSQAFPLLTHCTANSPVSELTVSPRKQTERNVKVCFHHEVEAVYARISDIHQTGRCVVWIRNTVTDAVDAYQKLVSIYGEACQLFHARFTMGDRLAIENDVLNRFGKTSDHRHRQGRILIGTQVLNESIDADFDHMISDLAPIDSLVQRAGRLQRHIRDSNGAAVNHGQDARSAPVLEILGPNPGNCSNPDWYENFFPKASYVYPDHGQLWLSANKLQQTSAIRTPAESRELIEAVYGPEAEQNIPEPLKQRNHKADGDRRAAASTGQLNSLKLERGYESGGMVDWWNDAKTPTRLGEESITLVLYKNVNGALQPWNGRDKPLAESQISVLAANFETIARPESITEDEWQTAEESLPGNGQWLSLVVLERLGEAWRFVSKAKSGEKHQWIYCNGLGLRQAEGLTV